MRGGYGVMLNVLQLIVASWFLMLVLARVLLLWSRSIFIFVFEPSGQNFGNPKNLGATVACDRVLT